jgi:carboxypeptidase PM20D1
MFWLIIPGIVILFLAVLIVRALAFKPAGQKRPDIPELNIDEQKTVSNLAEMIKCKTVSNRDEALIDRNEFEKFKNVLKERFPKVHENLTLEYVGKSGLLYHWAGKASDKPAVFMAHYDVVPVNEDAWEKPAFEGILQDGVLWGRGTLDTKVTLLGVMESAEYLLSGGFVPAQDMYFAFAGDEEIAGDTAPAIVDVLAGRGIVPAIVVDEGGAVVQDIFPGVKAPCALIGIGEKGMMDMEISFSGQGGHASSPPPHTPVGLLAQAVVEVEKHPFKSQLTKPAAEMFDTLGRHSTFAYRLIFANLWCFKPVLDSMCKRKGGELNALMRTTCAFTTMEGSKATNVIPPHAKIGGNMRLIGTDTMESALEYLRTIVKNPALKIEKVHGMNPSIYSETQGESWERLKKAVMQTWPEAIVSPYLMVACSDSRHYCRISNHVYRFSAMALSKDERGMIHGNNERIPVESIVSAVKFYIRLLSQC